MNPPIDILHSEPFSNDLLNRKVEIENLSPILCNIDEPIVFAIDSPWGTGKTTFIKLWQKYLEGQNISSIYFNAWESDFADDPLIAIVSQIDNWITSRALYTTDKQIWTKAKSLLPGIAKSSVVAGVKLATLGALDLEKEVEKVVADLTSDVTEGLIDNFNNKSESIDEFKQLIGDVLSEVAGDQNNLIVFVDELDRCRPTYAIELLERIKHLFSIDKLVFVLSTDLEQLSHSICAVYGSEFNSRKYLQRFVDLEYSLKKPENDAYILNTFNSLGINDYLSKRKEGFHETEELRKSFSFLARRFGLSLREVNLFLTRIRLILLSIPESTRLEGPLIVSLLILKKSNPVLYSKYVSDAGTADEVIEYFGETLREEERFEDSFCYIAGALIASSHAVEGGKRLQVLLTPYTEVSKEKAAHNTKRFIAASKIIGIASHVNGYRSAVNHKSCIEQLELFHRINIFNS